MKINVKESEFILKNDILENAKHILRGKTKIETLELEYTKNGLKLDRKQFVKLHNIIDSFEISCRNRDSYEEFGIAVPISYIDIPAEMEDYKKDYDKYIHNVEKNRKEKS